MFLSVVVRSAGQMIELFVTKVARIVGDAAVRGHMLLTVPFQGEHLVTDRARELLLLPMHIVEMRLQTALVLERLPALGTRCRLFGWTVHSLLVVHHIEHEQSANVARDLLAARIMHLHMHVQTEPRMVTHSAIGTDIGGPFIAFDLCVGRFDVPPQVGLPHELFGALVARVNARRPQMALQLGRNDEFAVTLGTS